MATELYGANPGFHLEDVVSGVGSATSANNVELTVDLSTTIVKDGGSTRTISRTEVLLILELFKEYIVKNNWPPA